MIYKLQNGWTIPLGGDYLEYLQNVPEVSGGSIQPSVKTEKLPEKFHGSQQAARTYAEGYQKGAKPVTKAINNAGQKIFNTTKNVAMFVPGPTGAITWLGQMGADTANGEYSKVAKDLGAAVVIGAGLKGAQVGAKAAGRALAGKGVNIPWLDAYDYSALRGQYLDRTTNKVSRNTNIKSNSILNSTIDHLYTEYPELSSIGPKEAYRQYYETIFPASKVQTPYAHGTKSDLTGGLEASIKVPNAAAPETIGRNDFYLNLQPETSLQYADGIGVPKGFTWNKHRFWPLKEILGKPYKSDTWMSKPIKLREQIPNRAGQFSRVKNADGTYSGHGKLLEEYKAELGMQDLSNEEFLQRLGVQNEESFNQWVAKNRQMFSDIYNSGDYRGLYHVKIDATKPLTINGGNTYYSERGIWDRMNKSGNDVLLHNNAANEFGSDVAVVRDVTPQKVRILGSKPDQQDFADFMGGKQQFFTEIPTSPQEAATTYHFNGRIPLSRPISEAELKGWPKQLRNQKRRQISASEYSGLPKGERNNGRYGGIRFIRHMDAVPELTKDGFVQIAPERNYFANFTTDQLMVPHSEYPITGIGKNVLIINPEAFRGTTPFSLNPGDSFFINSELKIKPKHVTFVSGDETALQLARDRGFNVITSPKLKVLSPLTEPMTSEQLLDAMPALEKRGYGDTRFGPYRDFTKVKSDYVDELRRVINSNFNRPRLNEYSYLQEITGVPTNTYLRENTPFEQFFGPKTGYEQVVYDTTPIIEGNITKQMGAYSHPMAESMKKWSPTFFRSLRGWKPIKKQGGIIKGQNGLLNTWQKAYNSKFGKGLRDFMFGKDRDLSDEEYFEKYGYNKPVGGIGILGALVAPEWEGLEIPEIAAQHIGNQGKVLRWFESGNSKMLKVPIKETSKKVSNWQKFLKLSQQEQDDFVRRWNGESFKGYATLKGDKQALNKFRSWINSRK